MILKRITLNNFRQFYGTQTIDFSYDSNNNITVIKGENGCGKTGIYRAMIFCLYGEKSLSNEKKSQNSGDSEKVHLINFNYLDENKDKVVTASVKLEMNNGRKNYIITRSIDGKKNSINDEIAENEDLDVEMQIIDEAGNYDPTIIRDKNEVKKIVNDILDSGLKDFFFFDGEQIESLSKTDKDMREAIKNGITKLLQIDDLDRAIKIVDSAVREQQKTIKNNNPTSELSQIIDEKESIQAKINEKQAELDEIGQKLSDANENISNYEEKLQKNANIKQIYENINSQKELKNSKKENLQQNREQLKKILQENGSNLILDGYIIKAQTILNNIVSSDDLIISVDKLDEMLSDHKCLCCGREFSDNDLAHTYISKLKLLQEKTSGEKDISIIANNLKVNFNMNKDSLVALSDLLDKVESTKTSIDNITKHLQELNADVSSSSMQENDLRGYQLAKDQLVKEKEDLLKKHAVVSNEISQFTSTLQELIIREKEAKRAKQNQNTEIKKFEYLEELSALFTSIRDKYSLNMRKKLSNEATEIFRELISDKDKNLINKIEIGEKYEIIVRGWDNTSILQDISSGQRQIVSLAVIVGLAEIACNNKIDIPLFMDTPFGRVSGENRSNIISCLSKKVGQWILLVTDTEMTEFEYNELLKTRKWGKMYILDDSNQKGKTRLEEKNKDLYEPRKVTGGENNA